MNFKKTDLPDGSVAFTLTLSQEDIKKQYSQVTQMLLRNGLMENKASWMLLGLEAMAREIEEAENVCDINSKNSG